MSSAENIRPAAGNLISQIKGPRDLDSLDYQQLDVLAAQIRRLIIDTTSLRGGHLGSSLGAVELTIALHRILDCPTDKLVFDVGHQSYAHKIITGRREDFASLRTLGGLSGFTRPNESPYDVHYSGHASDSLSTAAGLAFARDLKGEDYQVVAMIGDASLAGGLAIEALSQIGQRQTKMVIVLNDNEMSISRNVTSRSLFLGKARASKEYRTLRDKVEKSFYHAGRLGKTLMDAGEKAKESFKKLIMPSTTFEDLGIVYIGPIDGHDIEDIEGALKAALSFDGPVLIHALTKKGKGYGPAEKNPELFHGVGPFDAATGNIKKDPDAPSTYTEILSQALIKEAAGDSRITAITAAMESGTGLSGFHKRFPNRFIDVGIAEEHAVTLAGGMALGGLRPVVAIYSSFLQRAFDEMIINVALPQLPVVFCIDRAGLVGEDGSTHHGCFDLPYLSLIPNMRILAPSNEAELVNALHTALQMEDGPVAIRYPRGSAQGVDIPDQAQVLEPGKGSCLREGKDLSLLAVGSMVPLAQQVADLLAQQGVEAAVYDMLWVKPLDEGIVAQAARTSLIVTLEDGTVEGGFGSAVESALDRLQQEEDAPHPPLVSFGLPDSFVPGGPLSELREKLGLDPESLASSILAALSR